MYSSLVRKTVTFIGIVLIASIAIRTDFVQPVIAQVMTSTNYRIQSDSINVGGSLSNSASYTLEDTTGEIATGDSDSATYKLRAGYQAMQITYLAITAAAADVTMSPSIGGISGGTANGSTNFTVTTDSAAGYQATLKASSSPALTSAEGSFDDYTPAAAGTPDFTFSVAVTDSEFAFTPEGTHIASKFKDNGAACNAGSSDTADACWYGLSTSEETIVQSSAANHPSGTQTTLKFRANSGSSHLQPEGVYVATTTITATAL